VVCVSKVVVCIRGGEWGIRGGEWGIRGGERGIRASSVVLRLHRVRVGAGLPKIVRQNGVRRGRCWGGNRTSRCGGHVHCRSATLRDDEIGCKRDALRQMLLACRSYSWPQWTRRRGAPPRQTKAHSGGRGADTRAGAQQNSGVAWRRRYHRLLKGSMHHSSVMTVPFALLAT
jgi:hypothetical protein